MTIINNNEEKLKMLKSISITRYNDDNLIRSPIFLPHIYTIQKNKLKYSVSEVQQYLDKNNEKHNCDAKLK